ncbi:MAG TPA: hypothetical protein VMW35_12240 [Myxococcota bacterium]|nr:hypothetical protein [Myxococcota bacterium]
MSLAQSLERAAAALPDLADAIRPANGDPTRLLAALGEAGGARTLAWLLDHEPEAGDELARSWAEDAAGAKIVVAVDEGILSKVGRKALRRVRHALRARGLAVPKAAPTPVVAALPKLADELAGAFLSPLDGAGARVAVLAEPQAGGGVRLFELIVDEVRGILEASVYETTRSDARRFEKNLVGRERFASHPVPLSAFQAVVRRCADAHPADRALPHAFLEWRSKLAGTLPGGDTPGALARAELGDDPSTDRLSRAAELARARAIGPWPPADLAPLREAAERIGDVAKSKLVVSDAQRREQIDAVLRDAARQVYGGPRAACTAAQLEESGWAFWRARQDDDARACLAAARALREQPEREHVATRALLEVALAPVLRAAQEEAEQGLIVRP